MSALFAFLHHLAAFALFAALAVELALLRGEPDVERARRLLRVDAAFGISAGVLLVVGFLRVFFFEKGAAYYFHDVPFLVKIALFALAGLLSVYPTLVFLSWRPALREGRPPGIDPARLRRVRAIVHLEATLVAAILLCAALMARGVGYFG